MNPLGVGMLALSRTIASGPPLDEGPSLCAQGTFSSLFLSRFTTSGITLLFRLAVAAASLQLHHVLRSRISRMYVHAWVQDCLTVHLGIPGKRTTQPLLSQCSSN